MKSHKILSRVENGKLKRNRLAVADAIKSFEGKEIEIVISRKYKKRSSCQNAFYWGVLIPFFQNLFREQWGDILSDTETHEVLKATCNYKEVPNPATGEVTKIPVSTTELTTSEWMDYEHKMAQLALDYFGEVLPEPNTQVTFNF